MKSNEVITYHIVDKNRQNRLIREAIDYALLSIPFTFDRLGNRNLTKNILNIAKGKIAENYFYAFCSDKSIELDTTSLSTPFYQADNRDFLFRDLEWDIKNNFLIHEKDLLPTASYLDLIALIPNRGPWDQWSKRNSVSRSNSKGTGYVFTFMKKNEPDASSDFLKIRMNLDQKNYLLDLYENFQGKHQYVSPYESEHFWNKFNSLGPNYDFDLSQFPYLVITGVAFNEDFINFSTFRPSDMKSTYLRTIIENMGIRIGDLKSFREFAGLS